MATPIRPDNPNRRAFIAAIGAAEGATYNTLVGGGRFSSYARHPNITVEYQPGKFSTAAGLGQFLARYWNGPKGWQAAWGLPDFSPTSQDAAILGIASDKGALGDIDAGRWQQAFTKVNGIWASLPGSPYGQRTRSMAFMLDAVSRSLGGKPVAVTPTTTTTTITNPSPLGSASDIDRPAPVTTLGLVDDPLSLLQIDGVTNPADVVRSAVVSLSTSMVSQLTITLDDSAGKLAGLFTAGKTVVRFAEWSFRVATVEEGDNSAGKGEVIIEARSELAQQLRHPPYDSPAVMSDITPADALAAVCTFLVAEQTSPPRANLDVRPPDTGPDVSAKAAKGETWWDASDRWAREEGFWRFDAGGTLYFGRPSWLITKLPRLTVEWRGAPDDVVMARPRCRTTEDDAEAKTPTTTVTLALHWRAGQKMRPAMALDVLGAGVSKPGVYVVTSVEGELRSRGTWTVTAQTPIDPPKEELTDSAGDDPFAEPTPDSTTTIMPGASNPGLPPGEAAPVGTGAGGGGGGSGVGAPASPRDDYETMRRALLANPRVRFSDAGKRKDIAEGGTGVGGQKVQLSVRMLRMLTRLAETHSFTISSVISSHPTYVAGTTTISPHKYGRGIDLSVVDGVHIANSGAGRDKAVQIAYEVMSMPSSYRPSQVSRPQSAVVTPRNGVQVFTNSGHNDHLHFTQPA